MKKKIEISGLTQKLKAFRESRGSVCIKKIIYSLWCVR